MWSYLTELTVCLWGNRAHQVLMGLLVRQDFQACQAVQDSQVPKDAEGQRVDLVLLVQLDLLELLVTPDLQESKDPQEPKEPVAQQECKVVLVHRRAVPVSVILW